MAKQTQKYHPRRDQLEQFLREGDARVSRHLESCEECRTAFRLMQTATSLRRVQSEYGQAEAMVQRFASVPALAAGPTQRPVAAACVSDSWQAPMAASVRHAGHGVERRLRYRARDLLIDLVVERLGARSECFLRVSRRGRPVRGLVLGLGNKKILPSDIGFFSWTAHQRPRQVLIWSPEVTIRLGDIRW
jgi:hypothetical protein